MTDNKILLWVAGAFGIGVVSGFVLGYNHGKNKAVQNEQIATPTTVKTEPTTVYVEQPKIEPENVNVVKLQNDPSKIKSDGPAKLATETTPGVDYTKYAEKVKELNYKVQSEAPTDGDDTELESSEDEEIEETMETYDERVLREQQMINEELDSYTKKKGRNIDVLGKSPIDKDYPDIHYDEEELLYFIPDDILTDELGSIVNEQELLGSKLRQFGWFQNNQEDVWVRNNPYSRDYHVKKINDDYKSYFPFINEED